MKIAVLATASPKGEQGGAERFYQGLRFALQRAGVVAEIISVISDESDFDHVKESYLRFYDLDLSAFDAVISTKAPAFLVRHPNHVCYLQHTMRVFYDMFGLERPRPSSEDIEQRKLIHRLDTLALRPPRTRRIFTISHEVSQRLLEFNGLNSDVLYQASTMSGFRQGGYDYIFVPGRLHRWKRVDLITKAMDFVSAPVRLIICGTGEDEPRLRSLAGKDSRISFIGRISDGDLLEYYANALAVAFVPLREDFGLITLEAFHSHKPVITCLDSGEPSRIVEHGRSGFVCPPEPRAIAQRIDQLAADPTLAKRMGDAGAAAIETIDWGKVAGCLLAGLAPAKNIRLSARQARPQASLSKLQLQVAVFDMQPIDPPTGGGRMRLLGLYHGLGCPTTYVGTYDWPGECARDHELSATLREVDVPLSEAHHAAARALSEQLQGKVVIDSAFPRLSHLSEQFRATALSHLETAEIVIFSHPWVYPQLRDRINRQRQLLVYDAHNVEALLRYKLLVGSDETGPAVELAREVIQVEGDLCRNAHLILACSHDDRQLFSRLYGIPLSRISIVPNGVFASDFEPPEERGRRAARAQLGLPDRFTAIFLASDYDPNVEAAEFIAASLAAELPRVTFIIAGSVGSALSKRPNIRPNIRLTGPISEDDKRCYLMAADLAVNPMFSGSGTNIKMFDFMAAGLPIVTTRVGARGLRRVFPRPFLEIAPTDMASAIAKLQGDGAACQALAKAGRQEALDFYSWRRISADLGLLLKAAWRSRAGPPTFSIVIPTYERPEQLTALMRKIKAQTETDFEVIVVDQSQEAWSEAAEISKFPLLYYRADVIGAVEARNKGALLARGEVLAFVDDDCLPAPDWLEKARAYFKELSVVGVEGRVTSEKVDNAQYRAVSNEGFRGMGFMTANLFIRRETFHALDGFDVAFDRPHFREDTDLGWRALEMGRIPYADDVVVYHPPHPRSIVREAESSRSAFFEKDALLFAKHPERYKELFIAEGHWRDTPGFWDNFMHGHEKYGIPVDPFFLEYKTDDASPHTSGNN
jgi:glycosyltransferase involved in cell wall biosynthesis